MRPPISREALLHAMKGVDRAQRETDAWRGWVDRAEEVVPCYVFLASRDASYMTAQVQHANGGDVVNG